LGRIWVELGTPPIWARQPGFATLIHIILEQQVSLASARAANNRLLAAASPLTPERFLEFEDTALKSIGFSRQKITFGRILAHALLDKKLKLDLLPTLDDDTARRELMSIKGIGRWSADIYLLMVLLRPNIWPASDLALAIALQEMKGLTFRPDEKQMDDFAASWQPWRAVTARLLWQSYLFNQKQPFQGGVSPHKNDQVHTASDERTACNSPDGDITPWL
jgi:DNA-3-methyladenine glycosylase II